MYRKKYGKPPSKKNNNKKQKVESNIAHQPSLVEVTGTIEMNLQSNKQKHQLTWGHLGPYPNLIK